MGRQASRRLRSPVPDYSNEHPKRSHDPWPCLPTPAAFIIISSNSALSQTIGAPQKTTNRWKFRIYNNLPYTHTQARTRSQAVAGESHHQIQTSMVLPSEQLEINYFF